MRIRKGKSAVISLNLTIYTIILMTLSEVQASFFDMR